MAMYRIGGTRNVWGVLAAFVLAVSSSGCGYSGGQAKSGGSTSATQGTVDRPACLDCAPILSSQEVAVVRETFPGFEPEEFGPGTNPVTSALVPSNFVPADFFGAPDSGSVEYTPVFNIPVTTNGYDGVSGPADVPDQVFYFTRGLTERKIPLGTVYRSPLNLLEQRMGVTLTPDAQTVAIDLRERRVSLSRIDQDMSFIRDQLAIRLPAVANVDPANVHVVIEPSIFYAYGTNDGDIWAGGLTTPLGSGHYLIQLADYYITFDSRGNPIVTNWEDYLVDEAVNFYVLSIGRNDLAR